MKNLAIAFTIILLSIACKNKPLAPSVTNETEMEILQEAEKIAAGMFMDGKHTTSGKVEIVFDKNDTKKKYLSFKGFKTDEGPDLRIYLAEDTKAKAYTEISKLTKTGDFLVELPTDAMPDKQKYVLIWCQRFSVLFGSAKLE
jgi:hypothetical protein